MNNNYIYHHGIKGMKWGVRRYQNKDGSLTKAGRKRYFGGDRKSDIIKNVEDYRKKYDSHNRIQEDADDKWIKAKELYKALGKTKVTRVLNSYRNESDAAKKYNQAWDDWNSTQELANLKWNDEVVVAYKKTGRTAVTRVLNNIKYDISKKRNR